MTVGSSSDLMRRPMAVNTVLPRQLAGRPSALVRLWVLGSTYAPRMLSAVILACLWLADNVGALHER
jgi:hypothetical protein